MTWLLVLSAVLILLLGLAGAGRYFFKLSIVRAEKEKSEEEYLQGENSIWNPFQEALQKAQKWIHKNTAEHVKLRSHDGLTLSALYIPSDTERPQGTCIVFHGYRSLATVDFAPEVQFLHGLGYRLLIPYQRSHGESQGTYITYGVRERLDCLAWAKYADRRFAGECIFLMGISMGASTVMMAADLDLPRSVRGIVADCGFTTPWDIMAHVAKRDYNLPAFPLLNAVELFARKKAGFSLKGADSRKALSRTEIPVLFLHGTADDFVPLSMTRENYAACRSKKELYLVEGAGHAQSFAMDPEGCQEKIAAFLEKYSGAV